MPSRLSSLNFTSKNDHICSNFLVSSLHENMQALEPRPYIFHISLRSSYWRCSGKIGVLKNVENFAGKYLCWSLLRNFIKKRLKRMCLPVKLAKYLRTPILKNICEWLLLQSEAVVQRCSVKKVFLEMLQNSQENTCARVSFLIKLQAPGTGVFLGILWNF